MERFQAVLVELDTSQRLRSDASVEPTCPDLTARQCEVVLPSYRISCRADS